MDAPARRLDAVTIDSADAAAILWRHALLMLATALLAVAAASDSIAQPTCTITWDGGAAPASNSWHDAANWTGDVLPGPTDRVSIPANTTVEVSQDAGSVLTVQSQGTLAISGGSLTLTDTTETSTTATLTQSGGATHRRRHHHGHRQLRLDRRPSPGSARRVPAGATLTINRRRSSAASFIEPAPSKTRRQSTGSSGPISAAGGSPDRERRHLRRPGRQLIPDRFRDGPLAFHNTGTLRSPPAPPRR